MGIMKNWKNMEITKTRKSMKNCQNNINIMREDITIYMNVLKASVPADIHRQVKAFAALNGQSVPDAYRSLIMLAFNGVGKTEDATHHGSS